MSKWPERKAGTDNDIADLLEENGVDQTTWDGMTCAIYLETGSALQTSQSLLREEGPVLTETGVLRVIRRNGLGDMIGPAHRPSKVEAYGLLIRALAASGQLERREIAARVGVSESTVYRALR